LQQTIDAILDDSLLAPCLFGAQIITAEGAHVLYERNSDKLFHPASNMKLLTTSAGLVALGDGYNMKTSFSSDGEIRDSTLHGSLFIHGAGDPLIRTDQLDSVAAAMYRRGIRSIAGDLVGGTSLFDTLAWGSGWMWDDEPSTDAAFMTPLTINSNSIEVDVFPGNKTGEKPEIHTLPVTSYVTIVNTATTTSDTLIPPLDVTRLRGQNTIVVSGRIPPQSAMKDFGVSVFQPEYYFLHLLRERLSARGISVHGALKLDTLRHAMPIAELAHPLDSILCQINKPSDNLAAEQLLKTLAVEKYHVPGSAVMGHQVVKEYLSSLGLDTMKMILADGSGLSWYNAVSPATLTKILADQYHRSSTFRHFYESLPIAGVDGTLKNRMRGTKAEGNVHAKTGSLTGVSSLSGYVTTADGTMLIFSILSNHFPGEIASLRNAQNRIMEYLANYSFTK
jgi:D-alanyl-D-alanine carboxypeptidase/D-alanyl-D-alanine-endopeptidase (penicillin-binding protein 4)